MPEHAPARRAFAATTGLLIAASAALGGAALLGWAQVDVPVPLRGTVPVRVAGSAVLPALAPLALLALAAVAAVLATWRWARSLLGGLLLVAAVPPAIAALRVTEFTGAALATAALPARSGPAGAVTVLFLGPALAAGGAVLLAAAGAALVLWGHRMPRLGRRYQVPAAQPDGQLPPGGRFWERMDAGEDPTAPGPPGDGLPGRPELASNSRLRTGAEGERLECPRGDPRRGQS